MKTQIKKSRRAQSLFLAIISFTIPFSHAQEPSLQFQYSYQFQPHSLQPGAFHYSNKTNDPEYKPSLERTNKQTILQLQSLPSSATLAPEDTPLDVIRVIHLPQNPPRKELHISFEAKTDSPAQTQEWKKGKKTGIQIYFIKNEKKSQKSHLKIQPSKEWETFTKKLSIPEQSQAAVLSLTALNGDTLTTKNWKIRLE